jgi:hypothetical protein
MTMPASEGAYPVTVTFREDSSIGRLWGIPLIGIIVRVILAIPVFLVLFLVGIVAYVAILLLWIPVLLTGRQAGLVYTVVGGYLRCSTRVLAYVYLLAGQYPPLGVSEVAGEDVAVHVEEGQSINRLWGIPILGYFVRWIVLIPHFIVLWVLTIVAAFLLYVTWIPVLLTGRQAGLVYTLVGGWMRYYVRVIAYMLLLTDRYPPFGLGN